VTARALITTSCTATFQVILWCLWQLRRLPWRLGRLSEPLCWVPGPPWQAILLLLCFKSDIKNNYIFVFNNSNQLIFYGRVMMSEVEEARHEQTMPNEERAEIIELGLCGCECNFNRSTLFLSCRPTGLPFTSEAQLSFCFSPTHFSLFTNHSLTSWFCSGSLQKPQHHLSGSIDSFGIYSFDWS
jgi:hypothetical protein